MLSTSSDLKIRKLVYLPGGGGGGNTPRKEIYSKSLRIITLKCNSIQLYNDIQDLLQTSNHIQIICEQFQYTGQTQLT